VKIAAKDKMKTPSNNDKKANGNVLFWVGFNAVLNSCTIYFASRSFFCMKDMTAFQNGSFPLWPE
jgi:hypothetical protein